ncbi:MHJ_0274 family protein [Mycoplasma phocimorsus]|uniref:MHJ_0274 family protein n=1 Tax=Mycoplasma phocimorsus TaxID=3045839 RepID=UPI0024BF1441|nr:hypothetical protein [Mycoplasma phocimorsus]MDJ1646739.1 hypothetical protein [Mycoplasma phocimorsus]MDJ1647655.1 hypothetical protein [Mycoplasma phocimorsus]
MKFLAENKTMLIIVSIAILGLIGFVAYQFVTEKLRKKKILKEKAEFEKLCSDTYRKFINEIYELILSNDKLLQEFIVSIGDYKMGEITNIAKDTLKLIDRSEMYRNVFSKDEMYHDFVIHFMALYEEKSNMWEKRCDESVKWFKKEYVVVEEKAKQLLEVEMKAPKSKKLKKVKTIKEIK